MVRGLTKLIAKGKAGILIVFSTGKFSAAAAGEPNVDFVERECCVAQVTIPLQSALTGCRVEGSDAAADEIDVLVALKILRDVYRIAEYLCLNHRRHKKTQKAQKWFSSFRELQHFSGNCKFLS